MSYANIFFEIPLTRSASVNIFRAFWWALSLVGRAPHLQCGGHRFESGRVHNSEFEERLTSPAPLARARAPVSAKSRQGILNSAKSIPPATRRFETMSTTKIGRTTH